MTIGMRSQMAERRSSPRGRDWVADAVKQIEHGKLADFVILSDNPPAVKPEETITLKVVQTIKEGKSVYRATRAIGWKRTTSGLPSASKAFAGFAMEAHSEFNLLRATGGTDPCALYAIRNSRTPSAR